MLNKVIEWSSEQNGRKVLAVYKDQQIQQTLKEDWKMSVKIYQRMAKMRKRKK